MSLSSMRSPNHPDLMPPGRVWTTDEWEDIERKAREHRDYRVAARRTGGDYPQRIANWHARLLRWYAQRAGAR